MQERLAEPFSVTEMANLAMFSKFHFTRVFREATQISPGRFFGLLRLAEAKRLLLTTSMPVAEVSLAVGYASLGTFSTRFKGSVGMAPSAFRSTGGRHPYPRTATLRPGGGARICGDVSAPPTGYGLRVLLGLFPEPVPEGMPVRCTTAVIPGRFLLENVPAGRWFLLGYLGVAAGPDCGTPTHLVGVCGPITVRADTVITRGDLRLHAPRPLDPPVLTAQFELDRELDRELDDELDVEHSERVHA